ncbi:MAG: PHB depolymerase family esterase [Burkholderiaceae bacterium]
MNPVRRAARALRSAWRRFGARLRASLLGRWLEQVFTGRVRPGDATTGPAAAGSSGRSPGLAQALADGRLLMNWSEVSSRDGRLRLAPWLPPRRPVLALRPAQPRGPMKLLVWLHGCDQQPEGFASATGVERLVLEGDWLVIMPAQERLANPQRCWNWFDQATVDGRGEVAIVLAAIDAAVAAEPTPVRGVFIAGMSSGAALAAACAAAAPGRFIAAAFHSGVAAGAASSALRARRVLSDGPDRDVVESGARHAPAPIAGLIVHGDQDPVVAPVHARELLRQMRAIDGSLMAGRELPEPERTTREMIAGRETVSEFHGPHRLVMISGLGHAWSGGDPAWPYNDAHGPDATRLIARFFDEQVNAIVH